MKALIARLFPHKPSDEIWYLRRPRRTVVNLAPKTYVSRRVIVQLQIWAGAILGHKKTS